MNSNDLSEWQYYNGHLGVKRFEIVFCHTFAGDVTARDPLAI